MEKVLAPIKTANAWFDDIEEPYRFFFFVMVIAIPFSYLFAVNPPAGFILAAALIACRLVGRRPKDDSD